MKRAFEPLNIIRACLYVGYFRSITLKDRYSLSLQYNLSRCMLSGFFVEHNTLQHFENGRRRRSFINC